MLDLLGRAASSEQAKLELSKDLTANAETTEAIDFLVEQRWLKADDEGTWTATPVGRLWLSSLQYGDALVYYEYGGAAFLLSTISNRSETMVWHKGSFATIGIARMGWPEQFEVRKEAESTTNSGGFRMEEALATACGLIAEDVEIPESPKPVDLRRHMMNFLEHL